MIEVTVLMVTIRGQRMSLATTGNAGTDNRFNGWLAYVEGQGPNHYPVPAIDYAMRDHEQGNDALADLMFLAHWY